MTCGLPLGGGGRTLALADHRRRRERGEQHPGLELVDHVPQVLDLDLVDEEDEELDTRAVLLFAAVVKPCVNVR